MSMMVPGAWEPAPAHLVNKSPSQGETADGQEVIVLSPLQEGTWQREGPSDSNHLSLGEASVFLGVKGTSFRDRQTRSHLQVA